MKRSLKIMLLMVVVVFLMGCDNRDDITDNTTPSSSSTVNNTASGDQTESSSDTDTVIGTTAPTTVDIPNEERGYAASMFRTYADEDMQRLGVNKKLAVICSWESAALPESITSRFNELLVNKYGCDFVVEFIGFNTAVGMKYEYGEALQDIKTMGQQADIIVTGGGEARYTTLLENGYLVDLTDILKNTEDGKQIYEIYPKELWNRVERAGEIYGITAFSGIPEDVIVCNKELAEKLGIEVAEGFSFYDIGDMLEPVLEELTEQGLLGGYFFIPSIEMIMGYHNLEMYDEGCGIFVKQNASGDWTAFNPLLDAEFVKLCKTIREYKEKGLYVSNYKTEREIWDKIYTGKFVFYIGTTGSSESPVGIVDNKMYATYTGIVDVVVGETVNNYLNLQESDVAGIASWSQYKEEALKLLRIMQTEEEIVNLLVYGIEGEHYIYEDREVIPRVTNIMKDAMRLAHASMLNNLLTYPVYLEPDDKEAYYAEKVTELEEGPFLKYKIMLNEYSELIAGYPELVEIHKQYYAELFDGRFEDVDATIAKVLKLQEEAGINELINKINKMFESGEVKNE